MDIKDEILLRLSNTLNSKDSYITYLQKLLREHDIDYQDFQLFDNPVDLELLKQKKDVASSKSSKFPLSSNSLLQNQACIQNKNIGSEASSVSPSANLKEQIRVQPQSSSERQLHSHQRIYLPKITSEHINRFIFMVEKMYMPTDQARKILKQVNTDTIQNVLIFSNRGYV